MHSPLWAGEAHGKLLDVTGAIIGSEYICPSQPTADKRQLVLPIILWLEFFHSW